MNVTLATSRINLIRIFGLLCLILAACGTSNGRVSETNTPIIESEKPSQIPTPNVTIEILPDGNSEIRKAEIKTIQQNNCGGNAPVYNEEQISESVNYSIEAGGGIELNLEGDIAPAGIGIQVGGAIAAEFGQTYGRQVAIAKSISLGTKEKTKAKHSVQIEEIWNIGKAKVVVGNREFIIPFKFHKDFQLELLETEVVDCSPFLPNPLAEQNGIVWDATFYGNKELQEPITLQGKIKGARNGLRVNWENDSPGGDTPVDFFSAKFFTTHNFLAGSYCFVIEVDDGAKLFIDGQEIRAVWWGYTPGAAYKTPVRLSEGPHDLLFYYFDEFEKSSFHVSWYERPGSECVTVGHPGVP